MIKLLDKEKNYVIVKMDIHTYDEIRAKKPSIKDLADEARKSDKVFTTHEDLMRELMS